MDNVTTLEEIKEKNMSLRDLEEKLEEEGKEICDFKRYLLEGGEQIIIMKTCKKGDKNDK